MPKKGKPPKLAEWFREKVYLHFGIPGLIGIAVLCAVFYVSTHLQEVKTWPVVGPVVEVITRQGVPKADPNRFSVLVAHLENDANREHERLIVKGLEEFKGIQVLKLDRTIRLEEGSVPEDKERQGHEEARRYLQKSGASVLIWGMVLQLQGNTVPALYWTPSSGEDLSQKRYEAPRAEALLRLPVVFWSDLAEILRLLVVTSDGEFRAKEGHYFADQLPPFIARVKTLLKESAGRPGWDADARGATLVILADALQVLGDQSGKNEPLEEAVAAYRAALQENTRKRVPLEWARTQNKLGNALWRLGERESGTRRLEEALAAHREALQERTRERVPMDWASTQNNLGLTLWRLGERENGTTRLEESVTAYREALQERTRKRVPLDWAATQNNLGCALLSLGERESGTACLEEAVSACREALQERTRKRVPLDWAATQNNLGNALSRLGERENGTARLEEAVAAYQAALEVFEATQATFYVEKTQANLRRAEALLQERRK